MRIGSISMLCIALAAACAERPEPAAEDSAPIPEPGPGQPIANAVEPAPPPEAAAPAEPPADYPGVAGMNPAQRRAYKQGWSDCRAGRYSAPGSWAEAYRIGCAAAQEGR